MPDADSISRGHCIAATIDLQSRLNINDSFGQYDTFTNSQWETSGGRKGQVDGKRASVSLVMVWELLSLELLLCRVHRYLFASYNLQ